MTAGFDSSRPNIARVYDVLLGGKENFEADREAARRATEALPDLPLLVRENRAWVTHAAVRAARTGIGQFLDLGSGLPVNPAVHEVVREVNPAATVAYVDNDPVAVLHGRALTAKGAGPGVAVAQADLTAADAVLADAEVRGVIDLAAPCCVLLAAVLHFLPAPEAARVVTDWAGRLAPGSWIAVSVGHSKDMQASDRFAGQYRAAALYDHPPEVVAAWLQGLDLVPPGVCEARRWVSGIGGFPDQRAAFMTAAAAVKR